MKLDRKSTLVLIFAVLVEILAVMFLANGLFKEELVLELRKMTFCFTGLNKSLFIASAFIFLLSLNFVVLLGNQILNKSNLRLKRYQAILLAGSFFLSMIGVVLTLIIGAGLCVATPTFTVTNKSEVNMQVTAHWRQEVKGLGELTPSDEVQFTVNDEAAMVFKAVKPDGSVLSSEPAVYFTSGTSTSAVITGSSIEVNTRL